LQAGDVERADHIIEQAEHEYGPESKVLYEMDRGMTLHLAGRYQASNGFLEQAEQEVERLYTRHLRTEAKAFLINDSKLNYEGEPYEQTMINVLKGLNYAAIGNWIEAVVEARRIDNRLNVLADRSSSKDGYRDDAFARYLSGVFYEVIGDLNNAFIAYRKAYDEYRAVRSWSRVPVPPMLKADLLRVTDAIHLDQEHAEYAREFGDVAWRTRRDLQSLGQLVVVTLNGHAPHKEDRFIDVPVSLDAIGLVVLTKVPPHANSQERRMAESALYGLNGHVVRIAVPALVPQKTQVEYVQVTASGPTGSFTARSDLAQNLTALAERTLADHLAGISVKAVARAVSKFALADGIGRGAGAAAGRDAGPWVGILVGGIAKTIAIASEEADKRSWRTLPDEIHIARLWLPPGTYDVRLQPVRRGGGPMGHDVARTVTVQSGEAKLMAERVLP
jgi:hypothetical protein